MFRYAVKVLRDSGPLRHNETHCTGADANGRERTGMLPFRTLEKTRRRLAEPACPVRGRPSTGPSLPWPCPRFESISA